MKTAEATTAAIDELRALGVDVSDGEAPAVVRERLQAQIVCVVTTDPETFDRGLYDRLTELWMAMAPEPETTP